MRAPIKKSDLDNTSRYWSSWSWSQHCRLLYQTKWSRRNVHSRTTFIWTSNGPSISSNGRSSQVKFILGVQKYSNKYFREAIPKVPCWRKWTSVKKQHLMHDWSKEIEQMESQWEKRRNAQDHGRIYFSKIIYFDFFKISGSFLTTGSGRQEVHGSWRSQS